MSDHAACMGAEKCIQNFVSENLKGTDHFGDLGINGGIILKLI
jgi:hypothetical protein